MRFRADKPKSAVLEHPLHNHRAGAGSDMRAKRELTQIYFLVAVFLGLVALRPVTPELVPAPSDDAAVSSGFDSAGITLN